MYGLAYGKRADFFGVILGKDFCLFEVNYDFIQNMSRFCVTKSQNKWNNTENTGWLLEMVSEQNSFKSFGQRLFYV